MARSYKKVPCITDYSSKKFGKKSANRRIRHKEDVGDYSTYKKHYCQYDICDFKFFAWTPAKSTPIEWLGDGWLIKNYDDYTEEEKKEIKNKWKKEYFSK